MLFHFGKHLVPSSCYSTSGQHPQCQRDGRRLQDRFSGLSRQYRQVIGFPTSNDPLKDECHGINGIRQAIADSPTNV